MQLSLNFPQIPLPLDEVWEQISVDDRIVALETLAQLLAKAAMDEATREEHHE